MPRRQDIQSILIIGAGPIVIGQACEFDYSGAQACKALREEGYRVILVNSNPATIMTDPEMADAVYIEPITWQMVERIIAKEKPDAVLPTMGGQTALNCALELADHGVLEKYDVELIGASREAIRMAEDRELFRNAMDEIGLESPRSEIARSMEQAWEIQEKLGFPSIIRPSFTLGGSGGGIAYNREEFEDIVKRGLELSPDARGADRRVGAGLEGIRDGGGPRQGGQLHHRVLDREPGPDGRAHRRLDHRGAGADPDRQGIPAPARRLAGGAAQDRRGHRRLQRAVRRQCRDRPRGGDRDEPARVALLGAGLQGHRLPDRQGRGQAGRRLHAGRAEERDHRRPDAGLVRADHRLRGHQDPALRVREVPGHQRAPDHADEVGGRGHGHGPQHARVAAQGPARPGDRQERPGPDRAGPGQRRGHGHAQARAAPARCRAHLLPGRRASAPACRWRRCTG